MPSSNKPIISYFSFEAALKVKRATAKRRHIMLIKNAIA